MNTSYLRAIIGGQHQAVQALVRNIYEAHAERDTGDVEALTAEASRFGLKAPDVLRRLADLRRWKAEDHP